MTVTENISEILHGFMSNKYSIDLDISVITNLVEKTISESPSVDINTKEGQKEIIYTVKNILEKSLSQTPAAEKDADDFLVKLQNLEMMRNISLAAVKGSPTNPSSQPSGVSSLPTVPAAAAPMPAATPSVVYINSSEVASKKPSSWTMVNGGDRKWIYTFERSSIVWTGNDSFNPRSTTIKVNCVILNVTTFPVVIVDITGTTGQNVKIPCTNTSSISGVYKPINDHFATFLTLALPWTIKLLDQYGNIINLGKDLCQITSKQQTNQLSHKVITISDPSFCSEKDQLTFQNGAKGVVVSMKGNTCELNMASDANTLRVGEYIRNDTKQFLIILEVF